MAIAVGTGDVLMSRLREGRANTARGAAHFLRETVGRVRYAGARGQLTVRADSGFYTHAVVAVCRKMDVRFSSTIRHTKACTISSRPYLRRTGPRFPTGWTAPPLWRSIKYEEVYLKAYQTVAEARTGINAYLEFYNRQRPHQALGYRTPAEVYQHGQEERGAAAEEAGLPSGLVKPSAGVGDSLNLALGLS